jgi:hypothetical protein
MQIAIIEVRYPYKMSYLDEWQQAWQQAFPKFKTYNILKESELTDFKRSVTRFDLIVVLHSITADSNKWLKDLELILNSRMCPVILFVGNEYSNPWLSMESRLTNIRQINPEIIATQLTQNSGEMLYSDCGGRVIEIPHALPKRKLTHPAHESRTTDLGFRGFEYPWFLLDQDRNQIVREVSDYFAFSGLKVDISHSQRLDKDAWYSFLRDCKTTVASEGGSNFVFKTDDVWLEALGYLKSTEGKKFINNDFPGAKLIRSMPSGVKDVLRSVGKLLGKEQGATSVLSQEILDGVLSRINVSEYNFVSGKALTSRHLDAVFCGTWQILTPGHYNGVLTPGLHYSVWDPDNPETVLGEVRAAIETNRPASVYEELFEKNSYRSRINRLLDTLNFPI